MKSYMTPSLTAPCIEAKQKETYTFSLQVKPNDDGDNHTGWGLGNTTLHHDIRHHDDIIRMSYDIGQAPRMHNISDEVI